MAKILASYMSFNLCTAGPKDFKIEKRETVISMIKDDEDPLLPQKKIKIKSSIQ